MTSKNSSDGFFRIFRGAYLPAAAAMTVMCGITLILWLFCLSDTYVFNPFDSLIGLLSLCAFCGLSGALVFGTVILKRPSNDYLSFGISRQKQYVARWLAGAVAVVSAIAFVFLLVWISGVSHHTANNTKDTVAAFIYVIGGLLVIYALMALAYSCGNNIFESAVLAIILFICLIYFDGLYEAAQSLRFGSAYHTVYDYDYSSHIAFPDSFSYYEYMNPFNGILNYLMLGYSGDQDKVSMKEAGCSVVSCLIFIVILFVLGYIGFRKKTAENSGKLFKSAYIYKIVGVFISLSVFRVVLLSFDMKRFPLCLIAIVTAIVVNLLINSIFVRRFPEKTTPGVLIATVIFCVLFCHLDNKLPDAAQVESVEIYSKYNYTLDIQEIYVTDNFGYQINEDGNYAYSSENDLQLVKNLHEKIYADGYLNSAYEDSVNSLVEFSYKMKDGTEKYYSYKAVSPDAISEIYELEKSDSAKQNYASRDLSSIVTVYDGNMEGQGVISDTKGLYNALEKDILARDTSKICSHSAEDEYAVLSFSYDNNRIRVAAFNMYNDIIKDEPWWAEGYKFNDFETFYVFYRELTNGNLYGYNDTEYGLNYCLSGEFYVLGNEFVVSDENCEAIVIKAAEYYNRLADYDDFEIAEVAETVCGTCTEDGYNIVVTKDMTETVSFIENNISPAQFEENMYESVTVLSNEFFNTYVDSDSCLISHSMSTVSYLPDYDDYWFYEECTLGNYTDAETIESILNSSTAFCCQEDDICLAVFTTDVSVFTKFISISDYESIVK